MSKEAMMGMRMAAAMAGARGSVADRVGGVSLKEITRRTETEDYTQHSYNGREIVKCREQGIRKCTMYQRKLMRFDPQINMGRHARRAPVLTSFHLIDIETTDPTIEAWLRAALKPVLRKAVRTGANSWDFGFVGHEKVWINKDLPYIVATDSGEARVEVAKGSWVYKDLKDLDPERYWPYIYKDDGHFANIGHDAGGQLEEMVPAEKAWLVTHETEFGSLTGTPMLDPCFDPWSNCSFLRLFMNRYFERRGTPGIKGHAPQEVEHEDGTLTPGTQILGEILNNFLAGGVLVFPHELDEAQKPVWDAEYMVDDKRGDQFLAAIDYYETQKLRAMIIPERVLTQMQGYGTFAMALKHTETFEATLVGSLDELLDHINRWLIPPLLVANFGPNHAPASLSTVVRIGDRRDLIVQLLMATIAAEAKGGNMDTANLIDVVRSLGQLNIPIKTTSQARNQGALKDREKEFKEVEAVEDRQEDAVKAALSGGARMDRQGFRIPFGKELQKAWYEYTAADPEIGRTRKAARMAKAAARDSMDVLLARYGPAT